MYKKPNEAMDSAVLSMLGSGIRKPPELSPKDNPKWVELNQLYRMALKHYRNAEYTEFLAQETKESSKVFLKELRSRIENLAIELNIDIDEEGLG